MIDILKLDVEFAEWSSIVSIIKDGDLETVKQFVFEIHMMRSPGPSDYYWMYLELLPLENMGLRLFYYHANFAHYLCHELHYINTKYMGDNMHSTPH